MDDLQKWYRDRQKVVTALENDGGGAGDSSGREAEEEEIIEEEEEEEQKRLEQIESGTFPRTREIKKLRQRN